MRHSIVNGFLLAALLLCPQNVYSQEDDPCARSGKIALGVMVALGLTALEVATLVYPPVVTHKLLQEGHDGLASCVPAERFDDSTKDAMKMARTAFTVNAATAPVAIASFMTAYLIDSTKWRMGPVYALGTLGMASWFAGLGAELAGLIQSQKAYNQIFGGDIEYCSTPTTNGLENQKKSELRTVLGFSYFDVIMNGLVTLATGGVFLYDFWLRRCCQPLVESHV